MFVATGRNILLKTEGGASELTDVSGKALGGKQFIFSIGAEAEDCGAQVGDEVILFLPVSEKEQFVSLTAPNGDVYTLIQKHHLKCVDRKEPLVDEITSLIQKGIDNMNYNLDERD